MFPVEKAEVVKYLERLGLPVIFLAIILLLYTGVFPSPLSVLALEMREHKVALTTHMQEDARQTRLLGVICLSLEVKKGDCIRALLDLKEVP